MSNMLSLMPSTGCLFLAIGADSASGKSSRRVLSICEVPMNTAKTGMIGTISAIVGFLVAFLIYTSLENFSGIVKISAIVLSALAIGICQGFFIDRAWHRAVGTGTFVGILILWAPVVIVTYGFALLALPLLAAFAMLVFFGAKLGANLRANNCRSA